jgi:hypothetical protein
MEISKEKLMSIILENTTEVDEADIWQKSNTLASAIKKDGEIIGWDMLIDPTDYPRVKTDPDYEGKGRVNVIFTCDIEEFIRKHPDLINELKTRYNGNIKWSTDNCPATPHKSKSRVYYPLPDNEDNVDDIGRRPNQPSQNPRSPRNNMLRIFNDIVYSEFGMEKSKGIEFNKVLSKRSIPALITDDKKYEDAVFRKKTTTEKIMYRIQSMNTYETSQDFLKTVVARVAGKETKIMNTTYLARQFNEKYNNWDETKKNDKKYEGKTDIFGLDRRGYDELNLDISMKTILEIIGEKLGDNSFKWSINMINKFNRKRTDEPRIKTGKLQVITLLGDSYLDDGSIRVENVVELDPNKEVNNPMDDVAVSEGLIQTIYDFKQKVESIDPKSALKLANVRRSDVERVDESIMKITNNIMNSLKK